MGCEKTVGVGLIGRKILECKCDGERYGLRIGIQRKFSQRFYELIVIG